jgi:hypothetical protein
MIAISRVGFPHSDTPGSSLAYSSPRLFAVRRVLLRLFAPRHPPSTLSSLTWNLVLHKIPWPLVSCPLLSSSSLSMIAYDASPGRERPNGHTNSPPAKGKGFFECPGSSLTIGQLVRSNVFELAFPLGVGWRVRRGCCQPHHPAAFC